MQNLLSKNMIKIIKPHQVPSFIAPYLPSTPIIIEAGAFDGTDTKRLAAQWPQGIINAFEPVPEIFERLTANTKDIANIYRHPIALSDHNGTAEFFVSEKPAKPGIASQAGSLRAPKERLQHSPLIFPRKMTVNTKTVNDWAIENNIPSIDMLWLDMQGYELNVLKAISATLLDSVKVIHTEVAFIEAYEGQPTYPVVKEWLEHHGFIEIARDFENTTDWFFGNIVMLKK